jgi:putative tryptophan/tyrosine transport system substrate-binding protein
VKRREFITLVGGTAAWPLAAHAQQRPVIGYFNSGTSSTQVKNVAAFHRGLKEVGLVEGQNVEIDFVWGENHFERLPTLAAEVVARRPNVIVSNTLAALRTKAATSAIPIVFTTGDDPVRGGLVTSLSRPDANVTGVVFIAGTVGAKRLALLRQLVPKAATIVMLVYPGTTETESEKAEVSAAAQAVGQQMRIVELRSASEVEPGIAAAVSGGAGALLIGTGPFTFNNLPAIVTSVTRHAVPAMYSVREAADAGGLMSYGASISDAFRQAGLYAGRILKGEKPSDLPVVQSNRIELVINLTTAKSLGLEFHPQLLAIADEVIE